MTRARGRPSRCTVERLLPYQVTVPAENAGGKNIGLVEIFHAQIGVEKHSRWLRKDDRDYLVFCFADPQHAGAFQTLFELMAPNKD